MKLYHKKTENLVKILNKNMRQQKSMHKEQMDAARVAVEVFINFLTAQTTTTKQ